MILDPVEALAELVAIPSVNPMGRPVAGPPYFETRLTEYLAQTFQRLGLAVARQPVAPGQENLLARLDGDRPPEDGGRVILLDAHQDTVPVEGMTIPPFLPEVRGGRLYGRGACDVKGGMAAILAAVSRLAHERPKGLPTLIVSCTVNEEYGFTGAAALGRLWTSQPSALMPRRPDMAVAAEPTGLSVVVAHKGVIRWRCHTRGHAVHSSQPHSGDNAIYKMARAVQAIERYTREVLGSVPAHPLCGGPTLSVGTISGGVSVNTMPERCTIEIDRRVPPGEQPEDARRELIDYLAQTELVGAALEHERPFMQAPALTDESNAQVAERLASAVRAVTGECRRSGVPYATNAAFFSAAGVPAVVFGPGFLEQAHTQDEWIPLGQHRQAREVFYQFCRSAAE
jgi:acetylornithine deacetylase